MTAELSRERHEHAAARTELATEREAAARSVADHRVARDELDAIRTRLAAVSAADESERGTLRAEVRALRTQLLQLGAAAREQVNGQTHSLAAVQNAMEQLKAERPAAKATAEDLQTTNARLQLELGSLRAEAGARNAAAKRLHDEKLAVRFGLGFAGLPASPPACTHARSPARFLLLCRSRTPKPKT